MPPILSFLLAERTSQQATLYASETRRQAYQKLKTIEHSDKVFLINQVCRQYVTSKLYIRGACLQLEHLVLRYGTYGSPGYWSTDSKIIDYLLGKFQKVCKN
jgi:hypothetical protein